MRGRGGVALTPTTPPRRSLSSSTVSGKQQLDGESCCCCCGVAGGAQSTSPSECGGWRGGHPHAPHTSGSACCSSLMLQRSVKQTPTTHTHTPNPMLLFKALNLIRLWDKSITPPHPPAPIVTKRPCQRFKIDPLCPSPSPAESSEESDDSHMSAV